MLNLERQHKIMELLEEKNFMDVHSLSKILYTSESTIRRDLSVLENAGLIRRTFGGAALLAGINAEVPLAVREDIYNSEKEKIAKIASALIADGEAIIIDSSSSAFKLIQYLKTQGANTVLTNSPKVAIEIAKFPNINVYSTGGHLRENSLSYVGRTAKNTVQMFQLNTLFFSCVGISLEGGLTDTNEDEAELKNVMMAQVQKKVALVDSSKFGLITFCKICNFSAIDYLITDKDPGNEWRKALSDSNVKLLFP